jgi:hypothetical protein
VDECPGGQEAHDAHMALNGECPWCGAVDRGRIVEGSEPEDFG